MLRAFQEVLMKAILADDPVETLDRLLAETGELSPLERQWLEQLDPDGLRMTGLLVRKLRFEQLTRAAPDLAELFVHHPEEFMALFASYTRAVPPTAFLPADERKQFRQWQTASGHPATAHSPPRPGEEAIF